VCMNSFEGRTTIENQQIFYDVLYHLNVIFLQRIFEALNNISSYSKTTRIECAKAHYVFVSQIKEL
jgi:hypothetical protein